jgi:transcriptional regulator with XRE-family HTH domain
MRRPRPDSLAARLRAAQAYAGVSNPALADELGVSVETLSRMKNGKTTIPESVPGRVADFCGLPRAFMEVGFAPLDRPITDVERRVFELEDRVAGTSLASPAIAQEIAQRLQLAHIVPVADGGTNDPDNLVVVDPATHRLLDSLRRELEQLQRELAGVRPAAADGPPTPEGELGRVVRGDQPTPRTSPDTGSDQDRDAQRGTGG